MFKPEITLNIKSLTFVKAIAMKHKGKLFSCLLFVILLFTQCSDLFETDISRKKIKIMGPSNKMETKLKDIQFVWEGDADIKQYNMQVVTPNYTLIQNIIADTTLKGTKFLLKNMATGKYSFRIVGYNGKSRCFSDTLSFTITDATPAANLANDEK